MKKEFTLGALVIMGILFIVGIVFIFSSLSIGESAVTAAIQSRGGLMDTSDYQRIINITILNYQIAGIILSIIGGIGILLSVYLYAKK